MLNLAGNDDLIITLKIEFDKTSAIKVFNIKLKVFS